jgi:hypothetical protein
LIAVGVATVLWSIWKARNLACFEGKWPSETCSVVFQVAYWVQWWSKLQVKEHNMEKLVFFAKVLEKVAVEIFRSRGSWSPWIPRLQC